MSLETRERCDLCHEDITFFKGHVYRGRLTRLWRWWGSKDEEQEPVTLCGLCWDALREAVREARRSEETGSERPTFAGGGS